MKKKSIVFVIYIMMLLLTGCSKKDSKETFDVMLPAEPPTSSEEYVQFLESFDIMMPIEPPTSSEEYMQFLETLPINQDDYDRYIGNEIESSEILFDEESNQYINRIKYKLDYSEDNFYAMQSYITLDLELNEDRSEWELSEYNREHHSLADLSVVREILEDNVSGEYDVYYVDCINHKDKIMAKIDKWDYETYIAGSMKIELNDVYQGMIINMEGEVEAFQIKEKNLFINSIDNTASLNWILEEDGFRYTYESLSYKGQLFEVIFKEDTREIFIANTDKKRGEIYLYTLVKHDNVN